MHHRAMILIIFALLLRGALPGAAIVQTPSAARSVDGSFAWLVERTAPAVVNIASPSRAIGFGQEFIEQPQASRRGRLQSVASGVIVTADGHILTNHHVVDRLSDIKVFLSDDRELDAKVVGTDPMTDIALLKVDAAGLPTLAAGDSSAVQAGDIALAIGTPFGLRQSVSMGIISGTGRRGLGIHRYEEFIQTDAALNPGSSGGALINLRGELIGIITAGKEYSGIGFAVPIHLALSVMDQILMYGRVIRGWLGVTVQPLTVPAARAFGVTGVVNGALVADVSADGPADRAGVLTGDIIVKVDGKPVRDDSDLNLVIAAKPPGTAVHVAAYRAGREREFTITLIEEPAGAKRRAESEAVSLPGGPLGLSVQPLTREASRELDLRRPTRGVIVTGVKPASRASAAELSEGDIILEVDRRAVTTTEDFYAAVSPSNMQPVLFLIERSGSRMFVVVE
jgi:serine protease Do